MLNSKTIHKSSSSLQAPLGIECCYGDVNGVLTAALGAAFCHDRSASLHQLPPILYQLMLLSAAGQRHTALRGLKRLFEHLENQTEHQQSGTHGRMPNTTLMQVRTADVIAC